MTDEPDDPLFLTVEEVLALHEGQLRLFGGEGLLLRRLAMVADEHDCVGPDPAGLNPSRHEQQARLLRAVHEEGLEPKAELEERSEDLSQRRVLRSRSRHLATFGERN